MRLSLLARGPSGRGPLRRRAPRPRMSFLGGWQGHLREMRENAQTITAEMKGPPGLDSGDLAFRISTFCALGVLQTIESGGGWEI